MLRALSDAPTEPASPRRLADALRAGLRPVSRDAVSFAVVASAGWLLALSMPSFGEAWTRLLTNVIQASSRSDLDLATLLTQVQALFQSLLPLVVLVLVMTLLAWAAQGGLELRSRSARERIRMRPMRGLRTLWLAVKALVMVMAFASIAHHALRAIVTTPTADIGFAMRTLDRLSLLAASRLGVALSLLVVADLLVQRLLWREGLRMTREELRRELRETEADPSLRGEQRRQHGRPQDRRDGTVTPESTP